MSQKRVILFPFGSARMDPNEAYDEDLGENGFFLLFKVHPHPAQSLTSRPHIDFFCQNVEFRLYPNHCAGTSLNEAVDTYHV